MGGSFRRSHSAGQRRAQPTGLQPGSRTSPLDTAQKDDTAATMIASLSGLCCRIVVVVWPFPRSARSRWTQLHMVGSNLAALLTLTLSVALAVSMGYRAVSRFLARPRPGRPEPG